MAAAMFSAGLLVPLAVVPLAVVPLAKPAEAAFPGENGLIAFASNRTAGEGVDDPEGDFEIFTMNPDVTDLTQLTHAAMIPVQVVFFIAPQGAPSLTLLAFWGLTWALLGYAIFSEAREREAGPAVAASVYEGRE